MRGGWGGECRGPAVSSSSSTPDASTDILSRQESGAGKVVLSMWGGLWGGLRRGLALWSSSPTPDASTDILRREESGTKKGVC